MACTIQWPQFGRLQAAVSQDAVVRRGSAMSTLFAFLHHLCAFTLVSAVAVEFVLIRGELTLASARRLQIADMVLGIAAGALLIIGLSRVFFFEKGSEYYFQSHAFIAKFS